MRWSWSLGRIAGIRLRMHATFLLLLAWVALVYWQREPTIWSVLGGFLFIAAIFGSVILHELGHALMGRRFGVGTRDITLLPIGGVARLERMPDDPKQELAIAVAGPAVTVAIVLVVYALLRAVGQPVTLADTPDAAPVWAFVSQVLLVNIVLAVFNLLPAFPMDGGRMLRAGLAMRMDYGRATAIAARFGKAFALLFAVGGLFWLDNPFLVFIALFVWLGAAGEANAVQTRLALGTVPVSRVMITDVRTLDPGETLGSAVQHILGGFQHDFPVVEGGRVIGILTRADLLRALSRSGEATPVADVMQREFQTATVHEDVEDVFVRLQSCRCHTLPVLQDGVLAGVVTMENIGELLMVQAAMEGRDRGV